MELKERRERFVNIVSGFKTNADKRYNEDPNFKTAKLADDVAFLLSYENMMWDWMKFFERNIQPENISELIKIEDKDRAILELMEDKASVAEERNKLKAEINLLRKAIKDHPDLIIKKMLDEAFEWEDFIANCKRYSLKNKKHNDKFLKVKSQIQENQDV